MATIRSFATLQQGGERDTDECEAKLVRLELSGELFLQLNTYGTQNRKNVGARSQNMRLSRSAFDQLVEAGRKHFGISN